MIHDHNISTFNPMRDILVRYKATETNEVGDSIYLQAAYEGFETDEYDEKDTRTANALVAYLEKITQPPGDPTQKVPYNHVVPIVQSSGMGKSWLLDRVAKHLFTIPLNLRNPDENGYPPTDHQLFHFFVPLKTKTQAEATATLGAFLISLFTVCQNTLSMIVSEEVGAAEWRSWLKQGNTAQLVGHNRKKFYDSVLKTTKDLLNEPLFVAIANGRINTVQPLPESVAGLTASGSGSSDGSRMQTSNSGSSLESAEDAQMQDLSKPISEQTFRGRLLSAFGSLRSVAPKGKPIMVYIDEAHTLTERDNGKSRHGSLLDSLSRICSLLVRDSFALVYASTNSWLGSLAPRPRDFPSKRDWEREYLHAPITQLPFDVFAKNSFSELVKAANQSPQLSSTSIPLMAVSRLEHLTRFGRPLWRAMYLKLQPDSQDIVLYVRDKFCSPNTVTERAKLAALAIRVILDFDTSREPARLLEAQLVRSHLRVAFVVPEHREFMFTGTPSEPLLVEAVSQFMDPGGTNHLQTTAPDLLASFYAEGFLAKGERGEVVARLLWILARDAVSNRLWSEEAQTSSPPSTLDPGVRFHRPILVLDWLKALLHPRHHQTVLAARPMGDSNGLTLREAFQDVWINFTHFTRAGDYKVIQDGTLWKNLVRSMAYQCAPNQHSVDLVAPLFHAKIPGGWQEKTSALLGQVKNIQQRQNNVVVDPTVSSPRNSTVPTLSIVMHLGEIPDVSLVDVPTMEFPNTRHAVKTGRNSSIHLFHYQIDVHGHSSDTYSVIPESANSQYSAILADRSMADECPHTSHPLLVEAVHRLQADYRDNSHSFEWV
ncbi:hypothetical protein B0H19DRAFT_1189266 [Mycena capillaripes]|nr:hypothetical protein B0H19DRAFT_1189266 [Mycena capillaripes]